MRLSRHVLKYLYIYYLPSGLFVVVSWVGFLIPPEVVPGRMAMLITLFLVLINIFNIVTTNSPNVEGMTAIGAWMLVCIFFVFGALIGYAYLLWKKKKSCLKRKRKRKQTEEEGKLRAMRKEDYRSKVDDVFFVVFPIMFLVFNLIYWPMCLSSRHSSQGWQGEGVGGAELHSPTPFLDLDTARGPSMGLPLGIYTNHYGKGCDRNTGDCEQVSPASLSAARHPLLKFICFSVSQSLTGREREINEIFCFANCSLCSWAHRIGPLVFLH